VFGFDKDLGLVGNQFANMSSLFFVTYVLFEVPWVQAMKYFGINNVTAVMIVAWSSITIGTGFVRNYHEVLASRMLLGAAEAGLFSACTFSVSTIYPRSSQGKRVAVLYGATCIAGAFGGLISYGIQLMGDRHGLAAWRWLFIVEGIISMVVGLLCWFTLPKNSHEAWFLTPEERKMMSDRRIRDIAYTGDDRFSWSYLRMALTDKVIIVGGLSLFCAGVPAFGFGLFLPTIIKGMG
jgi:sugar phosphate permease